MNFTDQIIVEKILNHTYRATLGSATGNGRSKASAIEDCKRNAVDILTNAKPVSIRVDRGYLIGSKIESSTSAWYFIKPLGDLHSADVRERLIYAQTFLSPADLDKAIEQHLSQYIEDAKKDFVGVCPVCLGTLLNSQRINGKLNCKLCTWKENVQA